LHSGECPADDDKLLAQLAERLSKNGIVLVLCTSPNRAEKLAGQIAELRLESQIPGDAISTRLDARIERELYPLSPLRDLYRKRIAFHHSQLPPRIRTALEDAISNKLIDIVCATTTLAEGVNFPFSTVIVESLIGQTYQITPRSLWNIAGRAGRFGVDSEGHCILFRPSKWRHRLKVYSLSDYISMKLDDIPPVKSALASGILELKDAIDNSELNPLSLDRS
jgi:replicative superfamily II helicase